MKGISTSAMIIALAIAGAAQAQTVTVFQTGFEPAEGYSTGNLNGQNGWSAYLGEDPTFGEVVNTGALAGSQSVLLDGLDVVAGTFGNYGGIVHSAVIAPNLAGVPLRYVETTGLCKIIDPTVIANQDSAWLVYYWSNTTPFTYVGAGIVNAQYRFGSPIHSSLSIPAQPAVTIQFRHLLDYQTGIARAWMNGQLAFQTSFNNTRYATTVRLDGSSTHLPCDARVWYDNLQIKAKYGPCAADINGDASADVNDLLAVISAWGNCPAPPATCPANIINTGTSANRVDVDDLLAVISGWGPCL